MQNRRNFKNVERSTYITNAGAYMIGLSAVRHLITDLRIVGDVIDAINYAAHNSRIKIGYTRARLADRNADFNFRVSNESQKTIVRKTTAQNKSGLPCA